MADPLGLSFSPAAQNGPNGQPVNGQRPSPIQTAIQTLSLRIPRVPGASAFTATPLLNSPGGSVFGNPNDVMTLEQLRRMLFGPPSNSGNDNGNVDASTPRVPTIAPWNQTPAGTATYTGQSAQSVSGSAASTIPPPRIVPGALPVPPSSGAAQSPAPADVDGPLAPRPAETAVTSVPLFYSNPERQQI